MASTASGFKLHHRLDRRFVTIMVIAIWLAIAGGFGWDLIHRPDRLADLRNLLMLGHAVVYTGWLVLLAVQVWLVRSGKVRSHMSLGRIAVPMIIAMAVLGPAAALVRAVAPDAPDATLAFLITQFTNVLCMVVLLSCGIALRRFPATHKRLMLLGAIAITEPGFARLFFGPLHAVLGDGFFQYLVVDYGGTILLVVAMGIYDKLTRGRLHLAYIVGAAWIFANEMLSAWLIYQPFWLDWMKALTGH